VTDDAHAFVEALHREESRRVLATLVRLLGDFDLAEEALAEAFHEAVRRWPTEGVPERPRAWLVSVGRRRAIDALRRRSRAEASLAIVAERLERVADEFVAAGTPGIAALAGELTDDRLRLVFACCHPKLPVEARIALTLREVCGLTTEEIARAFLTAPSTIAQRIVRAKQTLKGDGVLFEVPGPSEFAERLDTVLHVVYLVFTEGHFATSGAELVRGDLCSEAVRLARLLVELLDEAAPSPPATRADEAARAASPTHPEALGLLALLLSIDARRAGRVDAAGELVTLEHQDRSLWDRARIAEADVLVQRALATGRFGRYTLEAAIAVLHAQAPTADATDWPQIVALYDLVLRLAPSPIVALSRAIAVAMRDGPAVGLALIDELLVHEAATLATYAPTHAARADLLRRLDRRAEARDAYERALASASSPIERRSFETRIAELTKLMPKEVSASTSQEDRAEIGVEPTGTNNHTT
jgi:RNA polymerase sigma-70 factor (ECF subfamily)